MAGADGGEGTGARPGWRWDVALSFAGAQRDYVEQVARALQAWEVRCFYDADEQIELWGRYLAEELPAIYGEQVAVVVVFVSAEYAARDWTRHERRAALGRAVRERREFVLPARFDDTSLPGLLSGMVAVDLRGRTPEQFAAMVAAKLAALGITSADAAESPAQDARATRPAGAMPVTQADPRQLGVHAAISVPGVAERGLAGVRAAGCRCRRVGAPGPVLLIATLWPDRYTAYAAVAAPGVLDPRAREREVLDLAAVIRIGAEFSPAEQDRARAAAARDRRLALALARPGTG